MDNLYFAQAAIPRCRSIEISASNTEFSNTMSVWRSVRETFVWRCLTRKGDSSCHYKPGDKTTASQNVICQITAGPILHPVTDKNILSHSSNTKNKHALTEK